MGKNLANAVCERPLVSHISDLKECQMQKKKDSASDGIRFVASDITHNGLKSYQNRVILIFLHLRFHEIIMKCEEITRGNRGAIK